MFFLPNSGQSIDRPLSDLARVAPGWPTYGNPGIAGTRAAIHTSVQSYHSSVLGSPSDEKTYPRTAAMLFGLSSKLMCFT